MAFDKTCLKNGRSCACTKEGRDVCGAYQHGPLYPTIGDNGGPPLDNCGGQKCYRFECDDCYPPVPADSDDTVVNPKELAGAKKPAVWSVMPRWVSLAVGRVMTIGARKYGAFNYRESSISASVYQDAMERHMQLWFDGEDDDDETGVSHLASVIASATLLLDAQATGKLNDDRQKTGLVKPMLEKLQQMIAAD